MANLKEIRNRIGSVKNTRKITSAMSRIAAARLQRAQKALLASRPYAERVRAIVGDLANELVATDARVDHPLLEQRTAKRSLVVVVSADRGLCGGFNTAVARDAADLIRTQKSEGLEVVVYCVGRKAGAYLRSQKIAVDHVFAAPDSKTAVDLADEVAGALRGAFIDGADASGVVKGEAARADRVTVVYNRFKNVLTQETTRLPLLPFRTEHAAAPVAAAHGKHAQAAGRKFEPDIKTLVDYLVPMAVQATVVQVMLNSVASEIAARRNAMDAATDNASQLISDLTLVYNRERQAAITKELMEIIGGAEALKG